MTWSDAEPTDIRSPLSPASIKRIPKTGDLLMVWNDHADIAAVLRGKRTPLTVAVSRDEGKTWEKRKTLYDDPLAGTATRPSRSSTTACCWALCGAAGKGVVGAGYDRRHGVRRRLVVPIIARMETTAGGPRDTGLQPVPAS